MQKKAETAAANAAIGDVTRRHARTSGRFRTVGAIGALESCAETSANNEGKNKIGR